MKKYCNVCTNVNEHSKLPLNDAGCEWLCLGCETMK